MQEEWPKSTEEEAYVTRRPLRQLALWMAAARHTETLEAWPT
jgi:hypothetical protein